jgi:nucleotide-binding universal stress UspA family protein
LVTLAPFPDADERQQVVREAMMRALLAYDASSGADEAASLLMGMPWPAGAMVRVVAVIEPWATMVPTVPLMSAGLATSPELESQIEGYLDGAVGDMVKRLKDAGLEADGAVLRGRPADVLTDEARAWSADLVAVGSRGHGPIASLVLGSVSAELVDQAPCPVLVAKGSASQRVLFATDGSSSATAAEGLIATWPMFDTSTIRVVSVAEVAQPWHTGLAPTMYREVVNAYAEDLRTAKVELDALAQEAAARLTAAGRSAEARLRVGDAAAEIIDEASSWPADLVVLGSRGLTGLSRLVLGSVARNVLQGGRTSVLIVHDPAATQPEVA